MSANEPKLPDWLARLTSWRGNRRQTGLLGAALLAALGAPAPARGHHKKREARQDSVTAGAPGLGGQFCGGIAGIPCPRGFTCVDDPSDDCDPKSGGADCGGICVRKPRGRFCGGIAGIPCLKGFVCVDDPSDDCDPDNGGADCGGICVKKRKDPCSRIRCAAGTVCCPKCGGLCIPPDVPCTKELCLPTPCNQTVCRPGEYCCNRSCSLCAPLGDVCTQEVCPPPGPGQPCGKNVCDEGEFCCNPSCGECAPIGGACTARFCGPIDQVRCGKTICPKGQACCNASCGICTPPGMACIMIACDENETS